MLIDGIHCIAGEGEDGNGKNNNGAMIDGIRIDLQGVNPGGEAHVNSSPISEKNSFMVGSSLVVRTYIHCVVTFEPQLSVVSVDSNIAKKSEQRLALWIPGQEAYASRTITDRALSIEIYSSRNTLTSEPQQLTSRASDGHIGARNEFAERRSHLQRRFSNS